MKILNFLPELVAGVQRWERPPTVDELAETYYGPMAGAITELFGDAREMREVLMDLSWDSYRLETLKIDPKREEARVRKHLHDVEALLGVKLEGEIVLFGAFHAMDGYARFDRGSHRVFLGIDESHGRGRYLDILEVHELTHVARESRRGVWEGWGLDPFMTHDEFSENQPVLEHVFGEGFSCAVSELLVPCEEKWHYAYQEPEGFERVMAHSGSVDETVRRELRLGSEGDWGRLYSPGSYRPRMPVFAHYVWGWQFARALIGKRGSGDPKAVLSVCSREWVEDALDFSLARVSGPA